MDYNELPLEKDKLTPPKPYTAERAEEIWNSTKRSRAFSQISTAKKPYKTL